MTINEKSINRLGGGTEEAEAAKGEEDLENEDEVVLEVAATMITDEADRVEKTTGTVDQAAVTAVPLATMKGEEVEKIRRVHHQVVSYQKNKQERK